MIGIPNVNGSLIPNHPGTAEIFATALICLDLDLRPNRARGKVLPVPPAIAI